MNGKHEFLGIYRGIVKSNTDPKGGCRIFIPGFYPEEFEKEFTNLPIANPAMSLFGGNFTGSKGETGVCSTPHVGAYVYLFFENGDYNAPIYFAASQGGTGWFANNENEHVIKTDNCEIRINEKSGKAEVDVTVTGDVNITVNGNVHQIINGNYFKQVNGDVKEVINGNYDFIQLGNRDCTLNGAEIIHQNGISSRVYNGKHTNVYKNEYCEIFQGDKSSLVVGHSSETVNMGKDLSVKVSYNENIAGLYVIQALQTITVSSILNNVELTSTLGNVKLSSLKNLSNGSQIATI